MHVRVFVARNDAGDWDVCYGTDTLFERMSPESALAQSRDLRNAALDCVHLGGVDVDTVHDPKESQ